MQDGGWGGVMNEMGIERTKGGGRSEEQFRGEQQKEWGTRVKGRKSSGR
jgi:hypothetical protein